MYGLVAEMPPGVVTVTWYTPPSSTGGVLQVTWVGLTTVTSVASLPPKLTPVAPPRFAPVIVTSTPPAVDPLGGESVERNGG